jgi:hypothetical protein
MTMLSAIALVAGTGALIAVSTNFGQELVLAIVVCLS